MINKNNICVFDFETSGLSPTSDEAVQLAALMIDPYTLEVIPGSEFQSLIKPINIFAGSKEEINIKWNKSSGAWEKNKKTQEELQDAPLPQHVWKAFASYVKKYNTAGYNGKPIPAGHNIQGFDLYWVDELSRRHGTADKEGKQNIFNKRTVLDTLNLCFLWFENSVEPGDLQMDTLRKYFGINEIGHDAWVDVKTTSEILIRFMKLHRHFSNKVKFKNSFA